MTILTFHKSPMYYITFDFYRNSTSSWLSVCNIFLKFYIIHCICCHIHIYKYIDIDIYRFIVAYSSIYLALHFVIGIQLSHRCRLVNSSAAFSFSRFIFIVWPLNHSHCANSIELCIPELITHSSIRYKFILIETPNEIVLGIKWLFKSSKSAWRKKAKGPPTGTTSNQIIFSQIPQ